MAELGNHNTVFTSDDLNGVGDGYVMGPFGAGVSGTITAFHFYAKPGASNSVFRGLIYASSGADPGALLSTLPEHTVLSAGSAQWYDDTSLAVSFTGPIYLGFWQGTSAGVFHYSYDSTGAGFYSPTANFGTYSSSAAAANPWPASTDTPTSTQKVAVYVDYTPATSGVDLGAIQTVVQRRWR